MRGNEIWPQYLPRARGWEFSIPMRGNEFAHPLGVLRAPPQVFDPHEG